MADDNVVRAPHTSESTYPLIREDGASSARSARRGHDFSRISLHDNVQAHLGDYFQSIYVSGDYYGAGAFGLSEGSNIKFAALLKWLSPPHAHLRREQIAPRFPGTFDWVYSEPHFVEWLRSGSGIFWFQGKSGSGKSMLMKMLCEDLRTRELLQDWAQGAWLTTPSFFFWRSGGTVRRTVLGMVRSLLHFLLTARPSLADLLFPDFDTRLSSPELCYDELMSALSRLPSVTNSKFCFFIDSLDECSDDQSLLSTFLEDVSENDAAKVIVSGRPMPVLMHRFDSFPRLNIPKCTNEDIRRVVEHNLGSAERILSHERHWAEEITYLAEGSFLWATLVAKQAHFIADDGDCQESFVQHLKEMPRELESLYSYFLAHIPPRFHESAFRLLKTAHRWQFVNHALAGTANATDPRLTSLTLAFAVDSEWSMRHASGKTYPHDLARRQTQRLRLLLQPASHGLLELTSEGSVEFMHGTVVEFLASRDDNWWTSNFSRETVDGFNVDVAIMVALALRLRLETDSDLSDVPWRLCQLMDFVSLAEVSSNVCHLVVLKNVEHALVDRGYWIKETSAEQMVQAAIASGCVLYLEAILEQTVQNPTNVTVALVLAMTTPRRWRYQSIRSRMVKVLLSRGAQAATSQEDFSTDFSFDLITGNRSFVLRLWEIAVLMAIGCFFVEGTVIISPNAIDRLDGAEILNVLLENDRSVTGTSRVTAEFTVAGTLRPLSRGLAQVLHDVLDDETLSREVEGEWCTEELQRYKDIIRQSLSRLEGN